jgi:hypothetical protein
VILRRRADLRFKINGIDIIEPPLCFYHAVKAAMIGCPITETLHIESWSGADCTDCVVCDGYTHHTADDIFEVDGNDIMQKIRKIVQATGA